MINPVKSFLTHVLFVYTCYGLNLYQETFCPGHFVSLGAIHVYM